MTLTESMLVYSITNWFNLAQEKKMTDVLEIIRMSDVVEPIQKTKVKTAKPKMYHVIFLNDDFTPMDFVTVILQQIFSKSRAEAIAIMLEVHNFNRSVVGTYTHEIAEQKVYETIEIAKVNGHPLSAITEPAD